MISIQNLIKSYGDFRAVDDLSLRVEPGEILGLVGPNGAGKTTTLRCLSGVIPPDSGIIEIADHSLSDNPVAAKSGLAYVPDEPQLFDHLTSWDYLMVVARLYQVPDAERRAEELLEKFDLTNRRLAFPAELSRGMKQKLMIVAALLHEPKAMVLDEPLTGLDPRAMRQMKDTVVAAAERGVSMIVSSHMLRLVEEVCHRIAIIHQGRVVLDGALDTIRSGLPELDEDADLEEVFLRATEDKN